MVYSLARMVSIKIFYFTNHHSVRTLCLSNKYIAQGLETGSEMVEKISLKILTPKALSQCDYVIIDAILFFRSQVALS